MDQPIKNNAKMMGTVMTSPPGIMLRVRAAASAARMARYTMTAVAAYSPSLVACHTMRAHTWTM